MEGILTTAATYPKLAIAIHRMLPPVETQMHARAEAREGRFRQLLQRAAERSPFYRRKFHGIDLARCAIIDLPTVNKAEMMANLDEVFTDRDLRRADLEAFISNPSNIGAYYRCKY